MHKLNIFLLTPTQNSIFVNPMLGGGPILIGTLLCKKHRVVLHDNNGRIRRSKPAALLNRIEREYFDLLGLSINIANAAESYRFTQKVHKQFPALLIIAGGLHAYVCAEEMIDVGQIDIAFDGEAERSIVKVTDLLADHPEWRQRPLQPDFCDHLEKIPGLRFRREPGSEITFTGPSEQIQDLDELPNLDYSLVNLQDWMPPGPDRAGVLSMITSQRGCPYGCSFCKADFMAGKVRTNSADYVNKQIANIADKYGTDNFVFADNNFTIPKARAIEICKTLRESGLSDRLKFRCWTNVLSPLNDELLQAMKAANFQSIQFGLERLTQQGMLAVNKRVNDEKVAQLIKAIPAAGLRLYTNMLVGFPFESLDTLQAERQAFSKYSEYIYAYQVFVAMPLPGTTLYDADPSYKQWYLQPEFGNYQPSFFSMFHNDAGSSLILNRFKLPKAVNAEIAKMIRELAIDNCLQKIQSRSYRLMAHGGGMLARLSYWTVKVHPQLEAMLFAPVKKLFFNLREKAVRRFYASSELTGQATQPESSSLLNVEISECDHSENKTESPSKIPLDVVD